MVCSFLGTSSRYREFSPDCFHGAFLTVGWEELDDLGTEADADLGVVNDPFTVRFGLGSGLGSGADLESVDGLESAASQGVGAFAKVSW